MRPRLVSSQLLFLSKRIEGIRFFRERVNADRLQAASNIRAAKDLLIFELESQSLVRWYPVDFLCSIGT